MLKSPTLILQLLILLGISTVNAANKVPVTSLTNGCNPLINKNLEIKKTPIIALSERSYKRINRALEKLGAEKHDEAIDLLKKLFDSSQNKFTQSTAAKYLAVAYSRQAKNKQATEYFEKSLRLGVGFLQHKELQDLTQNVALMHYSGDNKQQAIKYFERWMKNSNVDDEQIYLLYADVLANSGQIKESICPSYWSAKMGQSPHKNAMNVLLNAHYQLKEFKGAIQILKQLILDFPEEKRYWINLANIYASQDKLHEALVVMELFYVQGLMETENDYLLLSQMFALNEIPYRTAVILKEGIDIGSVKDNDKNWKDIASNFHVAGELKQAIIAYGRSADKSNSGEMDLKRAELLADDGSFKQAVVGFDKALQKGSLEDPGKAYFRKGLAQYELKKYQQAIRSLLQAKKYSKWRSKSNQWKNYIKGIKERVASL